MADDVLFLHRHSVDILRQPMFSDCDVWVDVFACNTSGMCGRCMDVVGVVLYCVDVLFPAVIHCFQWSFIVSSGHSLFPVVIHCFQWSFIVSVISFSV
jgi:hypothetical protein